MRNTSEDNSAAEEAVLRALPYLSLMPADERKAFVMAARSHGLLSDLTTEALFKLWPDMVDA